MSHGYDDKSIAELALESSPMTETTVTSPLGSISAPVAAAASRARLVLVGSRESVGEERVVPFALPDHNRLALVVKRGIDILGASLFLIVSSPIIGLLGLLIKMESHGPIFFRQIRLGVNGKPFYMFKLRTMVSDAERRKKDLLAHNEQDGPAFKIRKDPRITTLGRLLRKFSLDELPQFVNVLMGDMSLVGPRPPLPKEVMRYETWQKRRLSVKPGVTCVWQVDGRNQVSFDDWVKLDLWYIDHWSLWLDIKLIARTLPAVLRGSGL